jgi:hypothetical protein
LNGTDYYKIYLNRFFFEVIDFPFYHNVYRFITDIKSSWKTWRETIIRFLTVIIIALGSAAGDPMFYEEVGIIPPITVFLVIILLYRLVTWLTR